MDPNRLGLGVCHQNNVEKKFISFQKPAESSRSKCICSRPIQDILCQACGFVFTGRARKTCLLHPRAIHLMDCTNCPKCKNTLLQEFRPSMAGRNRNSIGIERHDNKETRSQKSSPSFPNKDKIQPSFRTLEKNFLDSDVKASVVLDTEMGKFRQKVLFNNIATGLAKSEENWDEMADLGMSEKR